MNRAEQEQIHARWAARVAVASAHHAKAKTRRKMQRQSRKANR